jgi:hypothetical protein
MRVGISLLSGIIFLALTISATIIVYQAGIPIVQRMQSAAIIEQMKDTFSDLDDVIRRVASEGKGSRRTITLDVDPGEMFFNDSDDVVYWKYETDAFIMSPRTSQQFGNIILGSNMETSVYEANYTMISPQIQSYVLDNEYLTVYIRKLGNSSNYVSFNTSQLLVAIYQKDTGLWLNNSGFLNITIDDNATSASGNGYTQPEKIGPHQAYGSVIAYVNSSYLPYYINFTLESGTDFLDIEGSLA